MQLFRQTTGCGKASAAKIAGVTCKQSLAVANDLGIFAEDSRLWSETDHVYRLLQHFGLEDTPNESLIAS